MQDSQPQVIVVGGGLAGLAAAHTVLERGGRVVVLDKNGFLGGNSTKATSGINGTPTQAQRRLNIPDSAEAFYTDTARSARDRIRPELVQVLTHNSGSAVEWLQSRFGLDLSLVSRLGGHAFPRTHRGRERFPGMTITYALMERLEEVCEREPGRGRCLKKARVVGLVRGEEGEVVGVEYVVQGGGKGAKEGGKGGEEGRRLKEFGPVVLATGGYAADFTETSLLQKYRPDITHLPTTNGPHSTGDGHKMAFSIGANPVDMEMVQVHPTGLVDPKDPEATVKFLAAEALRGVGGILLDGNGKRFVDELGHRDHVTGEMWKHTGPFRLVLNSKASDEIEWHCKHYMGRGLMKHFHSGAEVAAEIGCAVSVLEQTFEEYNHAARTQKDPFGKKFFHNVPFSMSDHTFFVAIVTPVLHFTMGGLEINKHSQVLTRGGTPIPGLFAAGEIAGGVHGANRLGGSSLLACVVYGRVSGEAAVGYVEKMKKQKDRGLYGGESRSISFAGGFPLEAVISQGAGAAGAGGGVTRVAVDPERQVLHLDVSWGNVAGAAVVPRSPAGPPTPTPPQPGPGEPVPVAGPPPPTPATTPANAPATPASSAPKEYSMEQVSLHNKDDDCWIVVNGEVLDVTNFMDEHPGGAKALQLYAGKDATEEFNMLHKPDVIEKYANYTRIGVLAGTRRDDGTKVAQPTTELLLPSSSTTTSTTTLAQPSTTPSPAQEPLIVSPGKEQSLTCGGTEGMLDEERQQATFDLETFINALDGGADVTKRRRFIMSPGKMIQKPDGHHEWDRHKALKEHVRAYIKVHEAYWDTFKPTGMDIAWMGEYAFAGGSLMNHMMLFLSTLEMHASPEQRQWWVAKARRMSIVGCYAQTELGHGSNVRGLQTVAEYDQTKQEFVLNTPTLRSIKWWPGTLGKIATHAVVYAQLLIAGKEYGVHSFMVQIRDHNHHPLPGIRLGDLGPKMGDHANDTGYMIMNNVRIPREFMLANYQYVSPEGTYVVTDEKARNPRLHYSTMIVTRGMMTRSAGGKLARAVTIAVRYSCVREQGFRNGKDRSFKAAENKIIDYQIQQYRIFKQMALAYAIRITGAWMLNKMDTLRVTEGGMSGLDDLPQIAAISSGLKALATFLASQGIEDCRKCCGGNGYLLEAGIAPLIMDYLWQTTAEGDWIVLMLQTARYLLKRLQEAMEAKPAADMVPYLTNLGREPPIAAKSEESLLNLDYVLDLYMYGCQKALMNVGRRYQEKLKTTSGDVTGAINHLAVELMNVVRFHTMFTFLHQFVAFLSSVQDVPSRTALQDLCLMFGLSQLVDDSNWIGLVPESTITIAKSSIVTVMRRLRPNAVALSDAFDFPDRVLGSVLGNHDGNVYERLFEAAQRSSLNQVDPFDGYEEVLQPYLDRDLLARGNAVPPKTTKL